jgi:hypothetical protein
MSKQELIGSIKEKFQLALLMAIFFPTFLVTFLTAIKASQDQINKDVLSWSIQIAIYLSCYLIFDTGKNRFMREKVLEWLNISVRVGIGFFVIPIFFLALSTVPSTQAPEWVLWFDKMSFLTSIYGLQIVPVIVLVLSIIVVGSKAGDVHTAEVVPATKL